VELFQALSEGQRLAIFVFLLGSLWTLCARVLNNYTRDNRLRDERDDKQDEQISGIHITQAEHNERINNHSNQIADLQKRKD